MIRPYVSLCLMIALVGPLYAVGLLLLAGGALIIGAAGTLSKGIAWLAK